MFKVSTKTKKNAHAMNTRMSGVSIEECIDGLARFAKLVPWCNVAHMLTEYLTIGTFTKPTTANTAGAILVTSSSFSGTHKEMYPQ